MVIGFSILYFTSGLGRRNSCKFVTELNLTLIPIGSIPQRMIYENAILSLSFTSNTALLCRKLILFLEVLHFKGPSTWESRSVYGSQALSRGTITLPPTATIEPASINETSQLATPAQGTTYNGFTPTHSFPSTPNDPFHVPFKEGTDEDDSSFFVTEVELYQIRPKHMSNRRYVFARDAKVLLEGNLLSNK